ncbi:MAG: two pore domain potassium channel family protein [Candidatus Eisenbacteria bacterium]|uniref:Two pore domain potassium channel family protein n=1 Tax=Eiseniibacteriota bacterium TaxID=2212470 RepID=A0A538UAS5_UNCEI|nr:MAG: two pore domain potassium channel family protein [Candidatus Eisenbacteria bacterium]
MVRAMKPLVGAGALLLIAWVLWDAFETILLTRRVPARLRISRFVLSWLWSGWATIARRIAARGRRETFLSFYALLSILGLLIVWATGLVVGFALLHWAQGSQLAGVIGTGGGVATAGFAADLYMSGTTFFTLGLGDLHPMSPAARLITVTEAGTGFGFLALVIAYVPVLYQSFARREARITMLDAWAGSPPTAAVMLRRTLESTDPGVIAPLLRDWERTSAEILESHLSYPILCFFRSQHDNQSWLAAMVAILDACALVIVGVEGIDPFQARLTFAIARHALVDLSQTFRLKPVAPETLRLAPGTVAELRAWLAASGVRLREGAEADRKLAELRDLYTPYAHQLSQVLLMPLPPALPPPKARYNWQTTQWGRTAADEAHCWVGPGRRGRS